MDRFPSILIPVDASELSARAVAMCDAVIPGPAERTLLRIVTSHDIATSDVGEEAYLEAERARLEALGGDAARVVIQCGEDPVEGILAEIEASSPALVACMTHGRSGVRRWVLGSVAEQVVRRSRVPVLLGSAHAPTPIGAVRRILVPLDGTVGGDDAIEPGIALARTHDAELVLFEAGWVDPVDNPRAEAEREANARAELSAELNEAVGRLTAQGVRARGHAVLDHPDMGILRAIDNDDVDLVVMSTHGHKGLKRWVLGSVAERVVRTSSVPVLLVRREA
jgi:nucleotide-binding universal stress UspA family protein